MVCCYNLSGKEFDGHIPGCGSSFLKEQPKATNVITFIPAEIEEDYDPTSDVWYFCDACTERLVEVTPALQEEWGNFTIVVEPLLPIFT